MTTTPENFQISSKQAELYEQRFVPALFAQWADPLLDAVGLREGQSMLDVACGTGIVARVAAERVGPSGHVTGLDLNQAMLDVAGRLRPDLDWRPGDAADLPFGPDTFDVVTCQAALFFLPDVPAALREMGRVTRPGGTVGLQVFSTTQEQPVYDPWIQMVARHAGPAAMRMLNTYWSQGDLPALRAKCSSAGLAVTEVKELEQPAYFPSVEAMVLTEVNATPLRDRLAPVELDRIIADSYDILGPYRTDEGLTIPLTGAVLVATPEPTDGS